MERHHSLMIASTSSASSSSSLAEQNTKSLCTNAPLCQQQIKTENEINVFQSLTSSLPYRNRQTDSGRASIYDTAAFLSKGYKTKEIILIAFSS